MGCAVLGSWGSHHVLSVGCVALVRECWALALSIKATALFSLCCSKDIVLFVLEGAVGQLEGSVCAVHCPCCRFLTALTSPEYYKVSLS